MAAMAEFRFAVLVADTVAAWALLASTCHVTLLRDEGFVTLAPDAALPFSASVWLRGGRCPLGLDRFGVYRALAPRCRCRAHCRRVGGHRGCEGAEPTIAFFVGVFYACRWWRGAC